MESNEDDSPPIETQRHRVHGERFGCSIVHLLVLVLVLMLVLVLVLG